MSCDCPECLLVRIRQIYNLMLVDPAAAKAHALEILRLAGAYPVPHPADLTRMVVRAEGALFA